jgi:transposase
MGVISGMDPHKSSATIQVVDERAVVLSKGRFGTDRAGHAQLLAAGRKFDARVWAVEGCNGIGKHLAHRLVHDAETVVDVPAKLSAQVRVFATGNGRKTDPVDAHSVSSLQRDRTSASSKKPHPGPANHKPRTRAPAVS